MGCAASKPKNVYVAEETAARSHILKKEYAQAETLYREILKKKRQTLPLNHPDILDTMTSLAEVLEKQNKTKEAADIRAALRDRVLRQMHNAPKRPPPKKAPMPKKPPPPKKAAPKKIPPKTK